MKNVFSADIGATEIKYGIVSEEGKILYQSSIPTKAMTGPHVWFGRLTNIINSLKSEYDFDGVGISSSGQIDYETGKVIFALPQIPDYTGFDIAGFVKERCGLNCVAENDVDCAVYAESISGAGKGFSQVLGLTVGTGVGGGYILNGELLHGASCSALEVGYIEVKNSTLEKKGSVSGLISTVKRLKKDSSTDWNGKQIIESALKGDADCVKALDLQADALARGIRSLCFVLNPEVVILGGGIMQSDYLFDLVNKKLQKCLQPHILAKTSFKRAQYGNLAGMLGAAYLYFNRIKE